LGPLNESENNTLKSLIPTNFCLDFELKDRIILLASSGYFLRNFKSNEQKLDLLFGFLIRITYNTINNKENNNKVNSILDNNHKIKPEKKVLKKTQKNNKTSENKSKEIIAPKEDKSKEIIAPKEDKSKEIIVPKEDKSKEIIAPKDSLAPQQEYLIKIEEFKNRLLSNQSIESQNSQQQLND